MKKTIIMVLIALGCMINAHAQTQTIPNDAFGTEVKAIMDMTMGENKFAEILYSSFKVQFANKISDDKLKPMCDELSEVLTPLVYYSAYKAYMDIFTLDDLKEIHKFYETPAGEKLAKNLDKINAITMEVMAGPDTQQLIMPIIFKYLN